jgi:hypothetical protein
MKRTLAVSLGAVAAGCVLFPLVGWWLCPGSYERHFTSPLPATAHLEHHLGSHAGFDASYAFVFSVTDDALRDQLIAEWNLSPSGSPTSFVELRPPEWWKPRSLHQADEKYERFDEQNELYWSVWVDHDSGKVYTEYGNW